MKITNRAIKILILIAGTTWCASEAKASYDYTITDGGRLVGGFGVTLDKNTENGILVGGMQVTASGTPLPGHSSFTAVCLDLQGTLYLGQTYTFNEQPFSGQTGINPTWGNPVNSPPSQAASYQAINNAAYVFASHQNVTSATDWAALQLAVWKALYDTTANGSIVWDGASRFTVNNDPTVNDTAWIEAQTWLANLNRPTDYVGYLLQPTTNCGQEILVDMTPVPEPTTLAAGAMLLLPFGAGTLRGLRNRRSGN